MGKPTPCRGRKDRAISARPPKLSLQYLCQAIAAFICPKLTVGRAGERNARRWTKVHDSFEERRRTGAVPVNRRTFLGAGAMALTANAAPARRDGMFFSS